MEAQQQIILMHKETEVAAFFIEPRSGIISSRINVLDEKHLPIPVQFAPDNEFLTVQAMNKWVACRSIPNSRNNLSQFLKQYDVDSNVAASYKNFGLNLSDQYWFKPAEKSITWHEVNLFENDFATLDFSLGRQSLSPDCSSNGELPKEWRIRAGKRLLYKDGSGPLKQQPHNEVFADKLLSEIMLDHVSYHLVKEKGKIFSVCETFADANTEYIPALDIIGVLRKTNNDNAYMHFFRCAESLGIPINQKAIDNMLLFDYIINNTDRHYGNFGFIRDANTLQWKGMAPIFDNGNSLWYDQADKDMVGRNQPAKPFRDKWESQLKLISHADCAVSSLTAGVIENAAQDVFAGVENISDARIENIIRHVTHRSQIATKLLITNNNYL